MPLLPEKFIQSLEGITGFDKASFIAAHNEAIPTTSIRLNAGKPFDLQAHPFLHSVEKMDWCREGLYLPTRPSFVLDPLWHAGAYYVQEASSMFLQYILAQLSDATQYYKVLDLCAAPGGKTTLLANHFKNSLIVANETIKTRNTILVENTIRWGAENIVVTQNDPSHFKALPNFFDFIVVDAPCSGSGLFRKEEAAIKEWSLEQVQHCSQRQERIIDDSIVALQEGGYFIYATCSYSFEEDEKMMDYIAAKEGMELVQLNIPTAWNIVETFSPIYQAKGCRFFPNKLKGEGFFISVFKKASTMPVRLFSTAFKFDLLGKKEQIQLTSIFQLPADFQCISYQNEILAIRQFFYKDAQTIRAHLYVKKIGMHVGSIKGTDLVPAHDLALCHWTALPYEEVSVDLPTALAFLRRTDFTLTTSNKGWTCLSYLNIRLGWVKILPNRINNYYPNSWRILNY